MALLWASGLVRSVGVAIGTVFLASTVLPYAAVADDNRRGDRNHRARGEAEFRQIRDNDRRDSNWRDNNRRGDGRRDGGGRNNNWRDNNWRDNDRDRRDWNKRNHRGPRYDRYDYRYDNYWKHRDWRWNKHVYVYKPPRYVYAPRYYYKTHVDPWDVIVWGVLPLVIYQSLTVNARQSHQYAYNQAMAAPVGETIIWKDANSSGSVRITRDGWAGDRYCREFQQDIIVDGQKQNGWGIACQEPDGSWRLVPQS